MKHDMGEWIGAQVVLDTAGPILYLGTLDQVGDVGAWLADVDMHDCRDGHASKEKYLIDARLHGIAPNRARVFVPFSTIISVSRMQDILID